MANQGGWNDQDRDADRGYGASNLRHQNNDYRGDDLGGRSVEGQRRFTGSGRGDVNRFSGPYVGDTYDRNRSFGSSDDQTFDRSGYGGHYQGRSGASRDYGRGRIGHDLAQGREDFGSRGSYDPSGASFQFGDDEARSRHYAQQGGVHRGRGPKDYNRSDDRIREDVNDRLTDDPHVDASGISVTVKDGEVTLVGTVNHRHDKRHAEDLAEHVSGVKHVQNNVRIHDTNYDAQAAQAGSSSQNTTTGSISGSDFGGSTTRRN